MASLNLKPVRALLITLALMAAAIPGWCATNLALGKTATASSVENTTFAASAAVDGNTGTRWSSSFADPAWIAIDLGSAQTINRVVLRWEAAYGKDYQIQTSTNNSTWTTVYTRTGGTGGNEDFTFPAATARYVRMYGTARGTVYGYSLFEFEVYGTTSYNVTASAGTGGSISPSGTVAVSAGSSQTFTITPATGYSVSAVTVDGASAGAVTSYTFTNVQAAHTISATFALIPVNTNLAKGKTATASSVENTTLPASAAVDGSTTTRWASSFVDPSWIAVDLGSSMTFNRVVLRWEAAYSKDYQIQTSTNNSTWTTVYTKTGGTGGTEDFTFNAATARYIRMYGTARGTAWGHSLYEFEVYNSVVTQYTITASAGTGGSISPSGAVKVNQGASQTFAITPASGYTVNTLTVDGAAVTAATSYTFSNVTAAHTIAATFKAITYTITASAGANGAISPAGSVSVNAGASQTFTLTPASGYAVNTLTVDGTAVTAATSYTFSNVQAAHTIAATFVANSLYAWNEEFNGPDIDTTKWAFDIGTGANNDGWGNGEWEYYTSAKDNVAIENGNLVITLKPDSFGGKGFTSARMVTRGKYSFNHGRIVARIKMPYGNMVWPAFWLLGDHSDGWPACGELDIAEMFCGAVGEGDNAVFSTAHWFHDLPSPGGYANYGETFLNPVALSNDYHEWELNWSADQVSAKIDGTQYWVMDINDPSLSELSKNYFYMILNMAVGQPQWKMTSLSQADGPMPQKMYIDWIRVYPTADSSVLNKAALQPTGKFGIMADGSSVNSQLTLGTDANVYVWNNLTAITGTPAAGTASLAFQTATTDWFGLGIASTTRKNLMNYAAGTLNVTLKTTSTNTFKIGIAGGASGESWVTFTSGSDPYGFVRDGQWHTISIPMTKFGTSDFSDISQFFMFVSDGTVTAGQTFQFDEIYWSPNVAANLVTPVGTRFGIYTDRVCDAGTFNASTDGGFYIWNTANTQTLAGTPFEGANSFAFSAPLAQWYGLGFTPTKLYNLSAFAKGHLHISLKVPASSTTNFKIGLKSPGGANIRESWIKFVNGADPYGMKRDGQYHELLIPAADFCNSDFSAIAQLLMLSGDGAAQIEFDDIYWTSN